MSVLRKAKKGDVSGVVINNRYKWVEFETEDGHIVRVKIRTSLLGEEIEKISSINVNTIDISEMHDALHKYVEEWNILARFADEETGKEEIFEVIPPIEGGAESFKYAPKDLVYAIIGELLHESFKKVDPKSLTPVETTEKQ